MLVMGTAGSESTNRNLNLEIQYEERVTRVLPKMKEVAAIRLDPYRETADIDEANNYWPRQFVPSRFDMFKQQQGARGASTGGNPMQRAKQKK